MHTTSAAAIGMGETLRVVAAWLQDETDDLVETMLVRMRDEAPGFDTASRPELAEGLRASCYGNIRAALQALGGDRQPPRNSPPEAMNVARATARADIGLEPLLHTYRIGHAVVLERFFALIEDLDLSPAQRHSATLIGSKYLFAYVDRVVGEVSQEYTSERERVLRSSIQRRVQLVRDVLSGASIDGPELGYRLEQEHLAVVAAGPGADASLRDLARRLERRLLTVAMTDDTVWAWLGSSRRSGHDERHDTMWGADRGSDPLRSRRAGVGHLGVPRQPRAGARCPTGRRAPAATGDPLQRCRVRSGAAVRRPCRAPLRPARVGSVDRAGRSNPRAARHARQLPAVGVECRRHRSGAQRQRPHHRVSDSQHRERARPLRPGPQQ